MNAADARALRTGKAVRAGLAKGLRIAIEQAQARSRQRTVTIFYLAQADEAAGSPARGRAGRIARKLRGVLSESQVRKILRRLFSARDSMAHAPSRRRNLSHAT